MDRRRLLAVRGAPLQLSAAGPGGVLELSDAALQVRGGEQPQWRLGMHFIRQIYALLEEETHREKFGVITNEPSRMVTRGEQPNMKCEAMVTHFCDGAAFRGWSGAALVCTSAVKN